MPASIDKPIPIIATAGYAARGIVYLIISFFAALATFGLGDVKDSSGALQSLLGSTWGTILLIIIAAGLQCYAIWRFIQSVFDADDHGHGLTALLIRGGLFISAFTHTLLAIAIISWLIVGASSDNGDAAKNWSEKIMSYPGGIVAIYLIGIAVAGAGVAHIVKGWQSGFEKWFNMSSRFLQTVGPVFQAGLIVRGLIFILIGLFFGLAAWQHNADSAKGFKDTLEMIASQPYGPFLLGAIATGLFAFACYSLTEAVYREVQLTERP